MRAELDTSRFIEATDLVERRLGAARPAMAAILGSGWSDAVESFTVKAEVPYSEIPCLGETSVEGHPGKLLLLEQEGIEILAFLGRRHWYEGLGWEPVALPVRLCVSLGVSIVLLTNAAGGIREDLEPGTLMIIDDHINAMGSQPLAGTHSPFWGERFVDQSEVYDHGLRDLLDRAAKAAGVEVAHGVYLATPGPAYETPAEIRAFRILGADAIGMSTVPEATLASAAGLRVAALSCITNTAGSHDGGNVSHDAVLDVSRGAAAPMRGVLLAFLDQLRDRNGHTKR